MINLSIWDDLHSVIDHYLRLHKSKRNITACFRGMARDDDILTVRMPDFLEQSRSIRTPLCSRFCAVQSELPYLLHSLHDEWGLAQFRRRCADQPQAVAGFIVDVLGCAIYLPDKLFRSRFTLEQFVTFFWG